MRKRSCSFSKVEKLKGLVPAPTNYHFGLVAHESCRVNPFWVSRLILISCLNHLPNGSSLGIVHPQFAVRTSSNHDRRITADVHTEYLVFLFLIHPCDLPRCGILNDLPIRVSNYKVIICPRTLCLPHLFCSNDISSRFIHSFRCVQRQCWFAWNSIDNE